MGVGYVSGVLMNPLLLGLFLFVVAGISSVHYKPDRQPPLIRVHRLLVGYALAALACAVVSAALAYVSPEESLHRWKVPPERYWQAQLGEFLATFTLGLYATLLGIAAIGLPIITFRGRRGLASVSTVLLAAAVVSLAVAAVMASGNTPPFRHFGALARELVFGHMVIAAAFCVGAGVPWQLARREQT
jgi:hypothetical protein